MQINRVLKFNQLEAITDDVIEAAASILIIGNKRHKAITKRRHQALAITGERRTSSVDSARLAFGEFNQSLQRPVEFAVPK